MLTLFIVVVPTLHVLRQVAAFTTGTADVDHGSIGIVRKGRSHGVVIRNRHFADVVGRIVGKVHFDKTAFVFGGEFIQSVVDLFVDLKPGIFQAFTGRDSG